DCGEAAIDDLAAGRGYAQRIGLLARGMQVIVIAETIEAIITMEMDVALDAPVIRRSPRVGIVWRDLVVVSAGPAVDVGGGAERGAPDDEAVPDGAKVVDGLGAALVESQVADATVADCRHVRSLGRVETVDPVRVDRIILRVRGAVIVDVQ